MDLLGADVLDAAALGLDLLHELVAHVRHALLEHEPVRGLQRGCVSRRGAGWEGKGGGRGGGSVRGRGRRCGWRRAGGSWRRWWSTSGCRAAGPSGRPPALATHPCTAGSRGPAASALLSVCTSVCPSVAGVGHLGDAGLVELGVGPGLGEAEDAVDEAAHEPVRRILDNPPSLPFRGPFGREAGRRWGMRRRRQGGRQGRGRTSSCRRLGEWEWSEWGQSPQEGKLGRRRKYIQVSPFPGR